MKTLSICSLALASFIATNTANVKPASAETIYVYFGAVVQESEITQGSCVVQRALPTGNTLLAPDYDSSLCAVTQETIAADQAVADQPSLETTLAQPETDYVQITTVIR